MSNPSDSSSLDFSDLKLAPADNVFAWFEEAERLDG